MPYDFTYIWNVKNKTNQQTDKKYKYREQTGDYHKGGRMDEIGEGEKEVQNSSYKVNVIREYSQ